METLTNTLETINKGRWQWQSNPDPWDTKEIPQWESYSLDHNYLIEKAYYDQQKEVDLGDYLVYPLALLQRKKGNPEAQRPIRRVNWIDDEEVHHRSARYFESELPKTINRIFGGLGDFISFFSRRNKEILDFTSHFQELEKFNDLNILNQKIIPKLVECLEEVLLKPHEEKLKDVSLTQFKKKMLLKAKEKLEELISPFKKQFSSFEEFYGQILRAYTMNTDLYPDLNKYLRNESWMEVDKLMPYAFCLCKAFFNLKHQPNLTKLDPEPGRQNPSEELTSRKLYRGTAFDEFALSFYDPKKLQYFSWNAITSTTTNEKLAEEFMYNSVDVKKKKYPVMFIIEIPDTMESEEYLKWLDIRQYSAIPKEDEVILPPGSVFELLEIFTDQDKKTTIKIQLKTDVQSLAHGGLMMQGTLQSQMMTEKEVKIMYLDGEELSQALMSLHGNQLIEEVEICLCIFDDILSKKMFQILPTIGKLNTLKLISCSYEGSKKVRIERPKEREICKVRKIEVFEADNFLQMICNEGWDQQYWDSLTQLDIDFRGKRSLKDEELDCAISRGLKYFPQLTHFSMNFEKCRQITNEGMNRIAKGLIPLTKLTHLNVNFEGCVQIMDEGMDCLAQGLNSLIKLTHLKINFFSCEQIRDKGVHNFAQRLSSQLVHLSINLGECQQITNAALNSLAQGLNSLSRLGCLNLNLDCCEQITDKGVNSLAEGLNSQLINLTLTFNFCKQITDDGVNSLAKGLSSLIQLTHLKMDFGLCTQITEEGVSHLMSRGLKNLTKLTYLFLSFSYCEKITDQGMNTLACQWLHHLILFPSLIIKSQVLHNVSIKPQPIFIDSSWVKLVRENSHKYKQILSEEALEFQMTPTIIGSFRHSEKPLSQDLSDTIVFISAKNQEIDNAISTLKVSEVFSQISLLTSLNLDFLKHQKIITDDFIHNLAHQVLRRFPQLRSLTLIFCPSDQITDKGVGDLASYGLKPLTVLTFLHLDLFLCSQITDKGVTDLAWGGLRHLSQLRSLTLTLGNCKKVSDEGFMNLALHGLSHLSQLDSLALSLFRCLKITDEGLDGFVSQGLKYLTQLKSLMIDFAYSEISDKGVNNLIFQIIKDLPKLTLLFLQLGRCQNVSDFMIPHLLKTFHYFGFTKVLHDI